MRLLRVAMAMAVLTAVVAATGPVGADPSPPFPRLPLCGDDGDAPSSVEFNCDDVFAQMVDVQVFQVPPGVTELTIDYVYADELNQIIDASELFVFQVSNPSGDIGTTSPDDFFAYRQAVDAIRQSVFPFPSSPASGDVTLVVQPGDYLAFGLEQAVGDVGAIAYLTIDDANSGDEDHFVAFQSTVGTQLAFQGFVQDGEFDDGVFTVSPRLFDASDGTVGPDFVYVAIGDSFASGEGTGYFTNEIDTVYENGLNYLDGTIGDNTLTEFFAPNAADGNRCHRSLINYAKINAELLEPQASSLLIDRTCSGAQIDPPPSGPGEPVSRPITELSGPGGEPVANATGSQVEQALFELDEQGLDGSDVDFVTVSMSGNDAGFSDLVATCITARLVRQALDSIDALATGLYTEIALAYMRLRFGSCAALDLSNPDGAHARLGEVASKLESSYAEIGDAFPNASVFQVNYPTLLPRDFPTNSCSYIDARDAEYAIAIAGQLNSIIATEAAAAGVEVVDVSDRFGENPLCPLDPDNSLDAQLVNPIESGAAGRVLDRILDPTQEPGIYLDEATSGLQLVNCGAVWFSGGIFSDCYTDDLLDQFVAWFGTEGALMTLQSQLATVSPMVAPGDRDGAAFENFRGLFHPNPDGFETIACNVRAVYFNLAQQSCDSTPIVDLVYTLQGQPVIDLKPRSVVRGETIDFTVNGWDTATNIGVYFWSEPELVGTFTPDNSGSITGAVTVPAEATAGVHRLRFEGTTADGVPRRVTFLVSVDGLPQPGDLYGLYIEGLDPFETATVDYLDTLVGEVQADSTGAVFLEVLVPDYATVEPVPLTLIGETSGDHVVTIGAADPDSVCATAVPTIEGTAASEQIVGTNGDDVIFGRGGDDHIIAGNGDDIICTGPGDDHIIGAGGDDVIEAGDGSNKVNAGGGADVVVTGDGADEINLGGGSDTAQAGAGNDRINGGGGTDAVDGGDGTDRCTGVEQATNCE